MDAMRGPLEFPQEGIVISQRNMKELLELADKAEFYRGVYEFVRSAGARSDDFVNTPFYDCLGYVWSQVDDLLDALRWLPCYIADGRDYGVWD